MIYNAQDAARLRHGTLLVSALAWTAMLAMPAQLGHGVSHSSACPEELFDRELLAAAGLGWLIMLPAMMAPTTVGPLYHIHLSSFGQRRWRTSSIFLVSYGLLWMVAGGALSAIAHAASCAFRSTYFPVVACAIIACVWQASPSKQRCLNRCHRHRPLAAFGLAADRDAFRMGLEHGVWCIGSCWANMLLPLLLPHCQLAVMAAVTVLMFCERLDPPASPAWRLRGLQTALRWLRLKWLGPRATAIPCRTTRSEPLLRHF